MVGNTVCYLGRRLEMPEIQIIGTQGVWSKYIFKDM
jgi:hypothetical protein